MKIRELEIDDIPKVVQLKQEFRKDQKGRNTLGTNASNSYPEDCYREYNEYFTTSKKKKIFVAVNGDMIVGMIKVIIRENDPSFEFGKHAHICDLFVLEQYRSYKACIELYKSCKEWVKSQDCRYMTAYTFGFNELIKKSMHLIGMKEYKIMYVRDISSD